MDFRVIFVTEFDIVKGKIIEQLDRKFKMKKICVGFFTQLAQWEPKALLNTTLFAYRQQMAVREGSRK